MAWATPWTATTGQVVTAAQMNQIRDNLRYLKGLDGQVTLENNVALAYAAGSGAPNLIIKNTTGGAATAGQLSFYDPSDVVRGQLLGFGNQDGFRLYGGGPGRVVIWGAAGINSATPINVIPSGVSRRWAAWGVAYHSGGSGAFNAVNNVPNVQTTLYTDGTNILVAQASSGVLQIYRSGGSASFDVILFVAYQ